jgi:hypothetical protein
MAFRAIALVGRQSIGRPALVEPFHQSVPSLLGQDAGGCDGHIPLIAPHEAALGA